MCRAAHRVCHVAHPLVFNSTVSEGWVAGDFISVVAGQPPRIIVADDFNRPDSDVVGNGWSQTGDVQLVIRNNELTSTVTPGFGAIYRPVDLGGPLEVSATVKEKTGFAGLPRQYGAIVGIRNDGTAGGGYRLSFQRSDINFDNTTIVLLDGSTQVASIFPEVQFDEEIHFTALFNVDGSIHGTVATGGASFNFDFPAYDIQSAGANFIYGHEAPDTRQPSPVFHRMDNIRLSIPGGDLRPTVTLQASAIVGPDWF